MKLFKPKTIKSNIFLVSILQTSTPILLVGLISSIITLNILRVKAFNDTNAIFNDVSSGITDFSENTFDTSQSLLYDNILLDSIVSGSNNNDYITNLLNSLLVNNNEIQSASLVLNGCEYTSSQSKNLIYKYGSVGYNNIKNSIEKSNRGFVWYTPYKEGGYSDIFFTRQISNPYTGKSCGTLTFQFSNRVLSEILGSTSGKNELCVLSSSGQAIYKNFELSPDILNQTSDVNDGVISSFGRYYFHDTLPDLNWKIIYSVAKWPLYRLLYLLILLIALLCVLSVAIVVFFTRHINRTVVTPIQNLSSDMRDWSENTRIPQPKSFDVQEIDMLYDDFKNMTDKVDELINTNYKTELVRRESELKMLQSQINPHFIFNTLEAINSFAMIYDADEISDITVAFSELIEQSIGYETASAHTFEEELHLIDCYLTIMQIRFGNRFHVSKNIAPETLGVPTPSLIIQPIVENSISHGIIPSSRECELKINAYLENNDLVVKIIDDGIGFNGAKLVNLEKAFASDTASVEKSIGLINVNKRLTLLYGNDYRLKITSIPNKMTVVTVRIAVSSDNSSDEIEA